MCFETIEEVLRNQSTGYDLRIVPELDMLIRRIPSDFSDAELQRLSEGRAVHIWPLWSRDILL
jgi:hypothetical protein